MMLNNKKYIYGISVVILLIIAATTAGYFLGKDVQESNYENFLRSFKSVRENSTKYQFINSLVGVTSAPATDVGILTEIKSNISSYLQEEVVKSDLYGYSIYYRDLNTGLWFGINENEGFFPASLLKVPIAIATYKEAEDDPSFLKRLVVYTQKMSDLNSSVTANSQSSLVVGKAYTVEELVEIMLTQSDNGAKNLILSVINTVYVDKLLQVVALDDPHTDVVNKISSLNYALLIRILYGSTYLDDKDSERLLGYLSKSTFKDGLVAGLPESVSVAHKFGTYEFTDTVQGSQQPVQQLHDCGIVYFPTKPYVLCVMTRGKDLPNLYRIIAHISQMMYANQQVEQF